jgi:hypothetical protein
MKDITRADFDEVTALCDHVRAAQENARAGTDRRQASALLRTVWSEYQAALRTATIQARQRLGALITLYDLPARPAQGTPARPAGTPAAKRRTLAADVAAALYRTVGSALTAKGVSLLIGAPSNEVARVLRRMVQRGEAICDTTATPPTFQAAPEAAAPEEARVEAATPG